MKWQMSENSVFAILLRSSWWISAGVAGAVGTTALALFPAGYKTLGATLGLPFLVIAGIAAWRQWQLPSAARVDRTLEAVRAMSRGAVVTAIEAAYARDGYAVTRVDDAHADLAMKKEWRTALVSCKRWKVARIGVEPLRELLAAKEARELREAIFVATGEITDTARKFAAENGIRLVGGPELALLLPQIGRGKRLR
jgi:restriction system protein